MPIEPEKVEHAISFVDKMPDLAKADIEFLRGLAVEYAKQSALIKLPDFQKMVRLRDRIKTGTRNEELLRVKARLNNLVQSEFARIVESLEHKTAIKPLRKKDFE